MKNIYRVEWYNEDDYGIMGHTTVIVQAESETKAEEVAINAILKSINGDVLEHLSQYERKKIIDVTDKEVLHIDMEVI